MSKQNWQQPGGNTDKSVSSLRLCSQRPLVSRDIQQYQEELALFPHFWEGAGRREGKVINHRAGEWGSGSERRRIFAKFLVGESDVESPPESSMECRETTGSTKHPFITLKREQMYCMCVCMRACERDRRGTFPRECSNDVIIWNVIKCAPVCTQRACWQAVTFILSGFLVEN